MPWLSLNPDRMTEKKSFASMCLCGHTYLSTCVSVCVCVHAPQCRCGICQAGGQIKAIFKKLAQTGPKDFHGTVSLKLKSF